MKLTTARVAVGLLFSGVALFANFAATTLLADDNLVVSELGGKTQHLECDSNVCHINKNVGGSHSEHFDVSCQTGNVVLSESYCSSKSHWMDCTFGLIDATDFKCGCKNKDVAVHAVHLKVTCETQG